MSSSLKTSSLAKFVTSNIPTPRLAELLKGNIGKSVIRMETQQLEADVVEMDP
jgi:hypothetical protein